MDPKDFGTHQLQDDAVCALVQDLHICLRYTMLMQGMYMGTRAEEN